MALSRKTGYRGVLLCSHTAHHDAQGCVMAGAETLMIFPETGFFFFLSLTNPSTPVFSWVADCGQSSAGG